MQIALLEMQRRVQARVPLPWIRCEPEQLVARAGRRASGSCASATSRSTGPTSGSPSGRPPTSCGASKRSSPTTTKQLIGLVREGNQIEPIVERWYEATSGARARDRAGPRARGSAGEPRPGARARAAPVSGARGRSARPARGRLGMESGTLPVLRVGTGLRGDHAGRRSAAHLRPVHRAVDVRVADLPLLRERRPRAASRHSRRATAATACTPATPATAT